MLKSGTRAAGQCTHTNAGQRPGVVSTRTAGGQDAQGADLDICCSEEEGEVAEEAGDGHRGTRPMERPRPVVVAACRSGLGYCRGRGGG
jgi:hypothetical protein